ncbi:hypothetical protein [Streptomyces sp. NRRL S-337]|nr:hypothetical protein [Streptomyces sp. NRRL S-337]
MIKLLIRLSAMNEEPDLVFTGPAFCCSATGSQGGDRRGLLIS